MLSMLVCVCGYMCLYQRVSGCGAVTLNASGTVQKVVQIENNVLFLLFILSTMQAS